MKPEELEAEALDCLTGWGHLPTTMQTKYVAALLQRIHSAGRSAGLEDAAHILEEFTDVSEVVIDRIRAAKDKE